MPASTMQGAGSKLRRSTERVQHNCDNGHFWHPRMFFITKHRPWGYCNAEEKSCPHCGQQQSRKESLEEVPYKKAV